MYKNVKSSNSLFLCSGFILLISAIFLAVAIGIGYTSIKTKINTDKYTIASRVETSSYWSYKSKGLKTKMYTPTFFYNVEGKEYSCSSGSSSSTKFSFENRKIYYNSKNPELCISEYDFIQNCISVAIFSILSLPVFIFGLLILIKAIIRSNKNRFLAQKGQLIKDIPCKIIPSIILNDKQGYIIELEYEGLKLKSEPKFDIDIRRNTADLLIDPLDNKNYFIGFDIT